MTSTCDPAQRETEAAAWFARLNSRTISLSDLESFKMWRADPACRQAYEKIEAVWRRSGALAGDPDIAAELARIPDHRTTGARKRLAQPWVLGGAVAAVAVLIVGGWWLTRPTSYVTETGESRTVRLADGSRLQLDTDSAVTVRFGQGARNLELVRGRAMFDVAHDPSHPFTVHAGKTAVTALGTEFDVRREAGEIEVTLMRGRVKVAQEGQARPWTLKPGQQILIAEEGPGRADAALRSVDVAAAESWTTGRLVFQNVPLSEAVAEINRYADHPIVVKSQTLASRPLSGTFDTGDPAAFAEAVAQIHGATAVTRRDGGIALQ